MILVLVITVTIILTRSHMAKSRALLILLQDDGKNRAFKVRKEWI